MKHTTTFSCKHSETWTDTYATGPDTTEHWNHPCDECVRNGARQ